MSAMETISRPNGEVYQPRKVVAYFVYDADQMESGVIVLGTHDIGRAQRLADDLVHSWDAGCTPVDPFTGWYRDGFEGGVRRWVNDPEHGRAGVWFREITS